MRFRNAYMLVGGVLAILLLIITDPDVGFVQNLIFGAGTLATLILLFKTILYITLLHLSRKALMDYPEASLRRLGVEAIKNPVGAGLFAIAIGLITLGISIVVVGAAALG